MKNFFFRFRSPFIFSCIGFVVLLLVVISCNKTPYKYSYSEGLKPLPNSPWLPATAYNYSNTNGSSNDLITLGRVLFYDKNLSADNSVACGSCHQQANGFADNKPFSTGFGGQQTTRNAHSLCNTNDSKFWDGKVGGSSGVTPVGFGGDGGGYGGAQATPILTVPFQSHVELNMADGNVLCSKLSALPYYPYLFNKAFQSTTVSIDQIEQALGNFIATITVSNSLYDQYAMGTGTLNSQQQAGLAVFNGRGKCADCHMATSSFGGVDGQFEDIGLDLFYGTDKGRGGITGLSSDNGRFHVPSLKNVSLSAPYMHDGRFATLTQVVDFFSDSIHSSPNLSSAFTAHPHNTGNGYSTGGPAVPLGLTATEKSNLVAFLQTLTDNSLVTDVRYSDPFKH